MDYGNLKSSKMLKHTAHMNAAAFDVVLTNLGEPGKRLE